MLQIIQQVEQGILARETALLISTVEGRSITGQEAMSWSLDDYMTIHFVVGLHHYDAALSTLEL